jgi:hypothetical protein
MPTCDIDRQNVSCDTSTLHSLCFMNKTPKICRSDDKTARNNVKSLYCHTAPYIFGLLNERWGGDATLIVTFVVTKQRLSYI